MLKILSLIIVLFVAFMVGYCGGRENGFHELGAYFGIIDTEKVKNKK